METIQFENMQFVNLTEFHLSNLALVGKYFASKTYCLSDAYAGGGSIAKRNAEKDAINRMEEQCGWSYKIIDYNMNGFSSGYLLQLQQYTALVIDTQQWRRVVDIRTGRCLNGHYEIYCQQLEKQKKLLKRNCCEWDLMSL